MVLHVKMFPAHTRIQFLLFPDQALSETLVGGSTWSWLQAKARGQAGGTACLPRRQLSRFLISPTSTESEGYIKLAKAACAGETLQLCEEKVASTLTYDPCSPSAAIIPGKWKDR